MSSSPLFQHRRQLGSLLLSTHPLSKEDLRRELYSLLMIVEKELSLGPDKETTTKKKQLKDICLEPEQLLLPLKESRSPEEDSRSSPNGTPPSHVTEIVSSVASRLEKMITSYGWLHAYASTTEHLKFRLITSQRQSRLSVELKLEPIRSSEEISVKVQDWLMP